MQATHEVRGGPGLGTFGQQRSRLTGWARLHGPHCRLCPPRDTHRHTHTLTDRCDSGVCSCAHLTHAFSDARVCKLRTRRHRHAFVHRPPALLLLWLPTSALGAAQPSVSSSGHFLQGPCPDWPVTANSCTRTHTPLCPKEPSGVLPSCLPPPCQDLAPQGAAGWSVTHSGGGSSHPRGQFQARPHPSQQTPGEMSPRQVWQETGVHSCPQCMGPV